MVALTALAKANTTFDAMAQNGTRCVCVYVWTRFHFGLVLIDLCQLLTSRHNEHIDEDGLGGGRP